MSVSVCGGLEDREGDGCDAGSMTPMGDRDRTGNLGVTSGFGEADVSSRSSLESRLRQMQSPI